MHARSFKFEKYILHSLHHAEDDYSVFWDDYAYMNSREEWFYKDFGKPNATGGDCFARLLFVLHTSSREKWFARRTWRVYACALFALLFFPVRGTQPLKRSPVTCHPATACVCSKRRGAAGRYLPAAGGGVAQTDQQGRAAHHCQGGCTLE